MRAQAVAMFLQNIIDLAGARILNPGTVTPEAHHDLMQIMACAQEGAAMLRERGDRPIVSSCKECRACGCVECDDARDDRRCPAAEARGYERAAVIRFADRFLLDNGDEGIRDDFHSAIANGEHVK